MEELRNRLAAQKRRLIHLSNEVSECIDASSANPIISSLNQVWCKIRELLDSAVEVATGEEFEELLKGFNELEFIYINAKTRSVAVLEPSVPVQLTLDKFRVVLPTFKGGYLSWIKFRRIFRSCVVENDAFDDVKKLTLLKTVVAGQPFAIIQLENNFSRCWDLLHQVYHNRREIANALAKEILQLPKSYHDHECADDVVTAFREIYSGFVELNMFDLWDVLTTNALTECLGEEVVNGWRATLQDGFMPTLDDLLQFLDQQISNGSGF